MAATPPRVVDLHSSRAPSGARARPSAPTLLALLERPRALVMGVLNVTPDSFSDGGEFLAPDNAITQARRMVSEGADILDIGAESTRPYDGMQPVTSDEERSRLAPILPAIVGFGVPVSIDTMKAEVAAFALDAGASIVNDVWGLQRDKDMAPLVAARGVPVIVMHNRETADPAVDIIEDIFSFFTRSLAIAAEAGICPQNIILDPGIGFGKTPEQSMEALARLDEFLAFGRPLLVGASRKRFISSVVASQPHQRLGGSIAAHLMAVQSGARIIRAHDVADTVQALRIADAIEGQR